MYFSSLKCQKGEGLFDKTSSMQSRKQKSNYS